MINRNPVIGISGSSPDSASVQALIARFETLGADTLLLSHHPDIIAEQLDGVDAVCVMGNNFDIDPALYEGELSEKIRMPESADEQKRYYTRLGYEQTLIKAAVEHSKPLLAICGGMQLLNCIRLTDNPNEHPGSLHTLEDDILHVHDHALEAENVTPVHSITIIHDAWKELDSPSRGWASQSPESRDIDENSFHHQAIDRLHSEFDIAAVGEGDIIEAIIPKKDGLLGGKDIIALQWHPEFASSQLSHVLLEKFLDAAITRMEPPASQVEYAINVGRLEKLLAPELDYQI